MQSPLTEAAWVATRKKESYLKRFYQKLLIKKGSEKALIAVVHKLIIASYHILKNNEDYKEPVFQTQMNEERRKQKMIQKNVKELRSLGFSVRIVSTF